MFTARVWKNTGYNGNNIPGRPDDLEAMQYTDYPALDILTDMNLKEVKLHGTESDFRNVDYVRIFDNTHSTYYKVFDTPIPINGDTWTIPLTTDGILTAGGIFQIEFLDGITTRATMPENEDTFGAFCLDDELLAPSEPLQLDVYAVPVDNKTTTDGQGNVVPNPNWSENVYVETSIDLGLMACIDGSVEYVDNNGKDVIVPHSYPKMGRHTSYTYAGLTGVDTKTTVYPVGDNYDGKDPIQEGIQKCRGLGIENAIFNQVSIPSTFVNAVTQSQEVGDRLDTFGTVADSFCNFENPDTQQGETRTDIGKYNGFAAVLYPSADPPIRKTTYTFVREMQALGNIIPSLKPFEYDNTVKNKRVLYGGNNIYGILTTAGNRLESKPEDLVGGNQTAPRVIMKADPHLNGCPYYRFEFMNGNEAKDQSFFYNAVKGLQWKKVPLVFSETSGNILNTVEFENSRRIADFDYENTMTARAGRILSAVGFGDSPGDVGANLMAVGTGAMASGAAFAATGELPLALIANATGAAIAKFGDEVYKTYKKYENAKIQEISALAAKNNVSSPTIQIGYDNEFFRDTYGEVLFIYRYRPTSRDLARMDKLLTMYGFRVSIPVNEVNLNSRTKFNYLEADVSIGGNIPMYLKEIIRAQLSAGVRIWHKKPSDLDYLDNPGRTTP